MIDLEADERKVAEWLVPLDDETAPCGPDLEYDNDFLAVSQAATGKPESQFGPAAPPDWRQVVDGTAALLDRSRDLRIALLWTRGKVQLVGYGALVVGLRLINGMLTQFWDQVHPLPDPDDGDLYARVNALASMPETAGLLGDLRESRLIRDRAIGELTARHIAVALGLSIAAEDEPLLSKEQIIRMLGDAIAKTPALRTHCQEAVSLTRQLMAMASVKLGGDAPDLRPLYALVNGVVSLIPAEQAEAGGSAADDASGDAASSSVPGTRSQLSGAINSRAEAIRAIDMICEYLERAEPTNPAPLFLKRARQLVGQNFLQLLKTLAPQALAEVASMVGVDPDAIEGPQPP
jgi:type VI secretion system protein ImpA